MQSFSTITRKDTNGKLTYIEVPYNAKEVFGIIKGTIFVTGEINGVEYRSKLLSRGNGNYILVINKAMQNLIGMQEKMISVQVTMCLDNQANSQDKAITKMELAACNMDIITAIQNRRSIRKFTSEQIDDKIIYTILSAGLAAPTAKNKRPCHFIVVKNKESLLKLSQNNGNARMLMTAACGIIVCGDSNVESRKEFLHADCAAASQNSLLCVHGLGVGSVWCGVAANSDCKKFIIEKFDLPLKMEPFSVIALGYPDEIADPQDRWDLDKIHTDTW